MTHAPTFDQLRLGCALSLATELHRGQVRKGTAIPYVAHCMAVSALVAEDGGDEDQVIAGLLHDAAEDQGGEATLGLIADQFGGRVGRIVRDCSDSLTVRGEQKRPWLERKTAAVQRLPTVPADALTIVAADKLHNLRSTLTDLRLVGPPVWERFQTGRDGFMWYHDQVVALLAVQLPTSRSVGELQAVLGDLQRV